jgi:hypothetical protein
MSETKALRDLMNEIMSSRKGSIGSIDNVYLPQLTVKYVVQANEQLDALLAENERIKNALKTISNATISDCEGENWMKRVANAALERVKDG